MPLLHSEENKITPVAAVSGDDFEVVTWESDYDGTYIYCNLNDPDELYTEIKTYSHTYGTCYLHSLVTFKAANIPGAPVMIVDTYCKNVKIKLPRSVDEWEIKYYSCSDPFDQPDDKLLKNAGVVNLNEHFKGYIKDGLVLELSSGQFISQKFAPWPRWSIPSVD